MIEKQRENDAPAIRLSGVRKVFRHRSSGGNSIKDLALNMLALRRPKMLETVALDGIELEIEETSSELLDHIATFRAAAKA